MFFNRPKPNYTPNEVPKSQLSDHKYMKLTTVPEAHLQKLEDKVE